MIHITLLVANLFLLFSEHIYEFSGCLLGQTWFPWLIVPNVYVNCQRRRPKYFLQHSFHLAPGDSIEA